MKIEIAERAAARVAFLRYTGTFGAPLGKFWRNTVTPWLADHGLVDCPRYGIARDNSMTTPPEKCRYDACVELPPGLSVPDAAETSIAGGRFAITCFKGTAAEIGAAWSAFMGEYLADTAHRIDHSRPAYERYPRGSIYDARTGAFTCELCLPVA